MISITKDIALDESEVAMKFVHGAGPGGQNVNKVATVVQLRFDAAHSPTLPEPVRQRLMQIAGARITAAGELLIEARSGRTQERNREIAIRKLVEILRRAAKRPKRRIKTRPTLASRERRLKHKRKRAVKKELRRRVGHEE